jgi:hypothetical protein
MTKRQQILAAIKTAAAQGDMKTATRLFCEHRISRDAYDQAVESGRSLARMVAARDAGASA